MKNLLFIAFGAVCAVLCVGCKGGGARAEHPVRTVLPAPVQDRNVAEDMAIIRAFFSAVNARDINGYISLFCPGIQAEMREFVRRNGAARFFSDSRELRSVSAVADSYIVENAWLFDDVRSAFDGFCAYYVTEDDEFDEETAVKHRGVQTNLYVIVLENGVRTLYRVSASPPIGAAQLETVVENSL